MEEIYKFIGKVVAIGGSSVAIAYGLFIFVGKQWLENKFSERLEAYKHSLSKELEEIRFRINSLYNRVTKIHEIEIEVLPEAWKRLQRAANQIQYLISQGRKYPNFDLMSDTELDEQCVQWKFKKSEQEALKSAEDKF